MPTQTHSLHQLMHSRVTLVHKTILLTGLIFSLSLAVFATVTYRQLDQVATTHTRVLGDQLGRQLAMISAPLILQRDFISLNVLLSDLHQHENLIGAKVIDEDGRTLAKTGTFYNRSALIYPIRLDEHQLGSVHLHLTPINLIPSLGNLVQLAWPILCLTGLLSLIAGLWFGLHLYQPINRLNTAQQQLITDDKMVPVDDQRRDEWGIINHNLNSIHALQLLQAPNESQLELDISPVIEATSSTTSRAVSPIDSAIELPSDHAQYDLAKGLASSDDKANVGDALLRTARLQESIGLDFVSNLAPTTGDLQNQNVLAEAKTSPEDTFIPDQLVTQSQPSQDSEVIWGSLLYIGVNTLDDGSVTLGQEQHLRTAYFDILNQVCTIYGGQISICDNRDLQVLFDKPHRNMTHCVNALCAAQFFSGLSRHYNGQLLASGWPALNIQTVVHYGNLDAIEKVAGKAADLSKHLPTDNLIISAEVAYHPELQQRILKAKNCIQLSNGAFNLLRLSADYQDLLDQQIQHFSQFIHSPQDHT